MRIDATCDGGSRNAGFVSGQAFCSAQPKKHSSVISDILEMDSLSDTLTSQGDPCADGELYLGVADEVRCAYQEGLSSLIIAIQGVGNMHPKMDKVDLYFHNHAYPAGSKILISPYGQ